ncbi:MAG: TRAP transporter substrate-binding protein [Calditrichia bacterium]
MKRFVTHFCSSVLFLFFLGSCAEEKQEVLLRVGHVLDVNSTVHKSMEFMGTRLAELSDGTIRIEVYPSSQLGNERESLELLQLGSLDMTKVSAGVLENFVPAMGVYSLPYLFRDDDHYWQVFKGDIGRDILLQGEPYFLRGLCYYDAGFRSFFLAQQKVEEPEDLAGLKIRVMRSNLSIRTINLLGGNATPLAYSELYSALQQGVVDGAENNPPNFYQKKFYELCDYFVLDEHSAPPDVLVMSTHTWNKLSAEQQGWIDQSVRESLDLQRKLWGDMTNQALKAVEEAGVKVIRPDKSKFQDIVDPIYADLEGSELGNWASKIKALLPETPVENDSMEVQP